MHLTIHLRPVKADVILPVHYNHIVQAAIYHSIDSELAAFLHEQGFLNGKRIFKMFAFSLLRGPFAIDKARNLIKFTNEIQLTISSPVDEFCQSLVNTLLTRGYIRLGETEVAVEKVYAQQFKVENKEVPLKTLSPVVLYSTLLRPDGRKYTCYFQPGEPDYDKLLNSNLQKKYRAFCGTEPPAGQVRARTLGRQRMHVVNYKGTIVKGYSGKLILTGPIPLLQLAVDGGLGGKNAQGFGCVEVVGEEKSL
ncbi:MAG: CRISPR-associated endoribonuclease Cas6 [Firmicutes bacterium]|nr:CRISPR-associated endoribonuclease Cas6 [Bacillota bacterium]